MFTMAKIRNGGTYLSSHLAANDYYSKGEQVGGQWIGLAAEKLGLCGEVTPEQFEALRVNEHPASGKRLTPLTKSDRVAFFDFQCSAQKSVSIMAVLAGDSRLREAHARCSVFALGELEKFATCQRNTKVSRRIEITGNLCAAAFTHDASRALDPQLHTHFVVANATASGSQWRALNENLMVEAIRYGGKVYQNEMAREIRALGYEIRHVRDDGVVTGFEIEGVSDELCERFSKRRKEIEEGIEAFKRLNHREPTRAEISAITRDTRPSELREITTSDVRELQFGQVTPEEWAQLQSVYRQSREQTALPLAFPDVEKTALKSAVAQLFERKSVLREHNILAEALNQNLGMVELPKVAALVKAERAGLVRLTIDPAESLQSDYATREGLMSELWSVEFIKRTNGTCLPLNPAFVPDAKLYPEQRNAVLSILRNTDRVQSFRGVAGSGKTTTIGEVRRGLEEARRKTFALAATASAVETLRKEGFSNAMTIADFLQNGASKFDLENGIIICDEASLKSNRDGKALLRLAEKHNMRLLLVGDSKQHTSVEAGDCLRVWEEHSPLSHCEVGYIIRQKDEQYLKAIEHFADGAARDGMAALDALGWVHEGQSAYIKEAAASYLKLTNGGQNLDRCLAVCPTWEEGRLLTDDIRTSLKERDILSEPVATTRVHQSLNWTAEQKKNRQSYEAGQIVTFTKGVDQWKAGETAMVRKADDEGVLISCGQRETYLPLRSPDTFDVGFARPIEVCRGDKILILANRKKLGLVNGQVFTVAGAENGFLQTKEGVTIPATFKQWTHGYVLTSHKSQGRTYDHVVLAAAQLDAKAAYVACSRGKYQCAVHTPDKTALIARLPEGNRKAALDVLANTVRSPLLERPKAWQTAEMRGRKMRARRRQAEKMRQAVQRWHGERHLFPHLQRKMQGVTRTPDHSLNRESVHSIHQRNDTRGIHL